MIRPQSIQAWLLACRPKTLLVSVAPILLSGALSYSYGNIRVYALLAALFAALLIQIGTNFANDVFDFEKGADTEERLGPTRVTQAGLLRPEQVRMGMIVSFALSALFGLYLISIAGWPILLIGIFSIVSGVAYTGGPYPLGYNGLGDLFVFVFFGLIAVCGTVYVTIGTLPTAAIWASIPVGSLATAVLVVNNVRDYQTDKLAGKRTLVVRMGKRFGILEYVTLLCFAYAIPVLFSIVYGSFFCLLPLLTLPKARSLIRTLIREQGGPPLNIALAETAKLLLLHTLLFSLGIVFS